LDSGGGAKLSIRPMARRQTSPSITRLMVDKLIISYDGTENDDDALVLGRMLADAGFALALAYVRHSREFDPSRELLAQHDAEQRLERGAALLGSHEVARHVVFGASTGERLERLAETEGASLIVFGSDYRTPPGHVEPGTSAQHLLDGGSVAIGIAAAGLRARGDGAIRSIAVPLAGPTNEVARETASALADQLGATVVKSPTEPVDLIVVGSQPAAPAGRNLIGGDVRTELNNARSSVLVLPAGRPVLL
jgi:nucleotide-binding universal stress UspA family protein